jgi:hypothetical protein
MKKSKFLVLGLIALMLAGGLALASCGGKKCSIDFECERSNSCEYTGCGVNARASSCDCNP